MIGIKATKIIQNSEFVNSFGLSSLAFSLFWFFSFSKLGPVQTPYTPGQEGGAVEKIALPVFNTSRFPEMGTR
jgi:hypothetical protein